MKLLMFIFFYVLTSFTFAQDFELVNKFLQQKKNVIHNTNVALTIDPTLTENIKWKTTTNLPVTPTHILSSEIQITDSVYFWYWDESSPEWFVDGRIIDFVFNSNFQLEQYSLQYWEGNEWENYIRFTETFDEEGNRITTSMEEWDGNEWIFQYQSVYTYDEQQLLTSQVFEIWEGDAWSVTGRNIFTYHADQNLASTLHQDWNMDEWENGYQELYEYDEDDNLTRLLEQNWQGTVWVDRRQILNTFDHLGNQLFDLIQDYEGTDWVNFSQSGFNYDLENNRTYHLYQRWNGIEWENREQYYFTYDTANNPATELEETWNDTAWQTYSQIRYTHDENNFRLSEVYLYFEDGDPVAAYGDSTHYYYHVVTSTEDALLTINEVVPYPNPFSGLINIAMESDIVSVAAYSLSGNKIFHTIPSTNASSIEIDLSAHPKGMYILQVRTSTGVHCARVVLN